MKSGIRKLLYYLLLIAGTGMILVSAVNIGKILWGYHKSRAEYDSLREQVFAAAEQGREQAEYGNGAGNTQAADTEINNTAAQDTEAADGETGKRKNDDTQGVSGPAAMTPEERLEYGRSICLAVRGLQEQNQAVKGWLYFEQPDISYPIMQGEDNEQYLHHTWSGEYNSSGSIFLEALNNGDFQDSHTIIYGHNMKDGSMFGRLKNYRKQGFYEKASCFTVYTADRILEYRIFAYYEVSEDSELYCVYYEPSDEFAGLIQSMQKSSWLNTGVTVGSQNKIITLSTCSTEGKRFVVNAVRTAEYEVE